MHKYAVWLALMVSAPLWAAEQVRVQAHSVLRLPLNAASVHLQRLEIANDGTLMIPASVVSLQVEQLLMGPAARIVIAPDSTRFDLSVAQGTLAAGALISARGRPGSLEREASDARELRLRFEQLELSDLTIDARGGRGAPGAVGVDGADGRHGGCLWGAASDGQSGQDGGDGGRGAAGAQVRLELPAQVPAQALQVKVDGGAGGAAGSAGKGGTAAKGKGCLLYRTAGGASGSTARAGRPGDAGETGTLTLVRLP